MDGNDDREEGMFTENELAEIEAQAATVNLNRGN
jgi:hypothetical protein